MKKILAILIIAAVCAGLLLACAEETPLEEAGRGADVADEPAEDEGPPPRIEPNLPDVYFEGFTFTFLSHREESDDWYQPDPREIIAETETGAPINDAVFRRNAILSERYGFELDLVTNTDAVSILRRAVTAGDDLYGAVLLFNNHAPNAVQGGLLADVGMLTYVDWDKPWWDNAIKGMSVLGRNFLLAGDLMILDNEATNAIIFNKDLMRDLGRPLPYDLVDAGEWTLGAMEEMMRGAAADLDGSGVMTADGSRWGFVTYDDALHAFLVGGGGALAEKDENDVPVMSFATERNVLIFDRAMDIMLSDYTLNIQRDVDPGGDGNPNWTRTIRTTFEEDRALFMWVRMRVVEKFRGMESDFGILPIPKFDAGQPEYRSVVNPWTGVMLGVPITVSDPERTSIILEAMSAESRYTLQPAYYDIVLTRQFARDEESEAMLDLIFSTRVYDIGAVYNFATVFGNYIYLHARGNNRNILAYYERYAPRFQREIDMLVERIMDMD